jgi:hypothetical protein
MNELRATKTDDELAPALAGLVMFLVGLSGDWAWILVALPLVIGVAVILGLALLLLVTLVKTALAPNFGTLPQEASLPSQRDSLRFLRAFRWFCHGESGRIVEAAIADLTKDEHKMRKENRSEAFIRRAIWVQQVSIVACIVVDAVRRLRKPPRPGKGA